MQVTKKSSTTTEKTFCYLFSDSTYLSIQKKTQNAKIDGSCTSGNR